MKDLGIVICNFNKVDYLKGCLETLYKSNFEELLYDVIVVDNASTDESVEFVKKNYPSIILLENETNTGGSGGFDRGIQYVMKQDYTYVALLDNDILLESDTILNLIKYIKENPKVGVVGSKICTMDNPEILQEMGSFIDFSEKLNIETPLKSHKDDDSLPEVVSCDYVPACCLITTNEILNKVGSFNTKHFIYWDDMDWCTRVKRAGYEIHAINNSRVFHKMGAANHTNTFGVYYFERNRIMFFLKYIDEDKIESFINSICNWLLSVTFFSNLKGNYATPVSLLMAIDDLLLDNLGKQEKSIIKKENIKSIFEIYELNIEDKIAIFFNENMKANRIIYNALINFTKEIDFYVAERNYEIIKNNFDINIKIIKEDDEKNYDKFFVVINHILDYEKKDSLHENIIFVDEFLNSSSSKEIDNLLASYFMYKDIFMNIYKPVLKRRFLGIREYLRKEDI